MSVFLSVAVVAMTAFAVWPAVEAASRRASTLLGAPAAAAPGPVAPSALQPVCLFLAAVVAFAAVVGLDKGRRRAV